MADAKDRAAFASGYRDRASARQLAPLWEFFSDWFRPEPAVRALPHLWDYEQLRPLLLESADVVSTADAERRVLALENPGLQREHLVTDSLYAGLQLLQPGETARTHRHSAAALRFVIEGRGAYTAVDGEKAWMAPGDFVVTPSWTWHEHANPSSASMIWLDVLDVPLVRFLGAGFSEHYPAAAQPESRPPGDSLLRYGSGLRPYATPQPASKASPVFHYPYSAARQALDAARADEPGDPHHGWRLEYIDPTRGTPAIPTISTFLQLVPAGAATRAYRNTAGAVYTVVEGCGRVSIGETAAARSFAFGPRDLFAVPGWAPLVIEATADAVLFSASDRAVQQQLGLWRERRD